MNLKTTPASGPHPSLAPDLPVQPPQPGIPSFHHSTIPVPAPPHPSSPAPARSHTEHRHTGNVGRLPKPVRDQLSQMILDGIPYNQIKARLGEHGKTISTNNISNWKTDGGLAEYITEQDRLHDCRLRYEFLETLATRQSGATNYHAAPILAVALAAEALVDLGPDTLRKGLQQDPRNAFRLLNCLARLTSGGLRCEQFLLDAVERKARLQQSAEPDPEKGLSPQTSGHIIERLNLL